MSDWAIGLSTGCFYRTSIFECLEPIRAAGFSRIEICSFPKHLDYHDGDAVRRAAGLIEELSLDPFSLHAPFAEHIDITAPDPDARVRALDEILEAAEAAATLGVRHYVIHPGPEKTGLPEEERLERMNNAVSVLEQAAEHCRRLGIRLVLENMLPHLFSGRTSDLLWILGELRTTDVGICLDTGHAHLARDLPTAAHKLSGHLRMIHASDNRGRHDDHLPPGDGEIEWKALLEQLSAAGFSGTIILELAAGMDAQATLEGALRGRAHLRSAG